MKKILFILLLICPTTNSLWAQDSLSVNNNFGRANELYASEQYAAAIDMYEAILEQQGQSPELYYNLANAYYKSKEIGNAILNYERALRLRPFYADAKYNLSVAQSKVIDRIEANQRFFISDWTFTLMYLLHTNAWTIISASLFLVFLALLLVFAFAQKLNWRKIGFRGGLVALCLSMVCITFANFTHKHYVNRKEAIVMTGVTTVKSSPDDSGTDLFVLHEGTKVTIRESLSEWYEIELGNGSMGWIKTEEIERI